MVDSYVVRGPEPEQSKGLGEAELGIRLQTEIGIHMNPKVQDGQFGKFKPNEELQRWSRGMRTEIRH